jgi:hypothetical protein
MTQLPPGALVFFGATDDFAYGQIFLAPRDLTREQVIEQLHLENS